MIEVNNNLSSLSFRSIRDIARIYEIAHAIFRKAVNIYSRCHRLTPHFRDRMDRIDNLLIQTAASFKSITIDGKKYHSQHTCRAIGSAFEARANFFFLGFPLPDISSTRPRVPVEFWNAQEIVNCVAAFFSNAFKKSHRTTDHEEHLLGNLEFLLSSAGDTTAFVCSGNNCASEVSSRLKNAEKALNIAETLEAFLPNDRA